MNKVGYKRVGTSECEVSLRTLFDNFQPPIMPTYAQNLDL